MSAITWSQQYDSVKRQIQSKRSLGEIFNQQEIQEINYSVNYLEQLLQTMSQAPMEYQLYASELARRRLILDNLKKQLPNLPKAEPLHIENPSNNMNVSSNKTNTSNKFIGSSDRGLVQRQKEMIKLQDEMLIDISDGVDKLHQQAIAIGDEAKIHVRLLDDLDNNVGVTTSALQAESEHANRIKDQARMCYLYICVAVEVILLVLLLVIAYH